MSKIKIAAIGGDFIGPEVVNEGIKVLHKIETIYNFNFEILQLDGGGQYYLNHGIEWPEGSIDVCKSADAILFGAIGHPKSFLPDGNIAGANIILGLRLGLDLFANIRPTKLFPGVDHFISNKRTKMWKPDNVNFVIIRENTEGFYSSVLTNRTKVTKETTEVTDKRVITRMKSKRICEIAFQYLMNQANQHYMRKVTAIHKANLLPGCKLFMDEFYSVASKFPSIKVNDILVDSFSQDILKSPEKYSVCVTTNIFGDILTDMVSVMSGGMGMAPSGQINGWKQDSYGLFEPVHGSAPDISNKGIANPIATVLSVSMMLEWLGSKLNNPKLEKASKNVENAVIKLLKEQKVIPIELGGKAKTTEVGNEICKHLDQP